MSASHKRRMIDRRAKQNKRVGYSQRDSSVIANVKRFCSFMRAMNAKNGVGSKQARTKEFQKLEQRYGRGM